MLVLPYKLEDNFKVPFENNFIICTCTRLQTQRLSNIITHINLYTENSFRKICGDTR